MHCFLTHFHRGHEQQFDRQGLCPGLHKHTALIASIVQHPGDQPALGERRQTREPWAEALRVEVSRVGDDDDLWGQRLEGA
jgi:hypothetical protein